MGHYAFTTLRPQLGTLTFHDGARLTLADVPGLVAGAHEGRGKGVEHLKHLQKARCLAFVLDLSGGTAGALVDLSPEEQLAVLQVRSGVDLLSSVSCLSGVYM